MATTVSYLRKGMRPVLPARLATGAVVAALLFGTVLLTLQALLINRLAGIPYPLWEKREHKTTHSEHQL